MCCLIFNMYCILIYLKITENFLRFLHNKQFYLKIFIYIYIYIYIYIPKEYFCRYFKDDILWCTVFIADFGLLHIISIPISIFTWIRDFQATFLTALYNVFLALILRQMLEHFISSPIADGKSLFPQCSVHKEIYMIF